MIKRFALLIWVYHKKREELKRELLSKLPNQDPENRVFCGRHFQQMVIIGDIEDREYKYHVYQCPRCLSISRHPYTQQEQME